VLHCPLAVDVSAAHRTLFARALCGTGVLVLALGLLFEPERVARLHFRGHPTTELVEETRSTRVFLCALGLLLVAGGVLVPRVLRRRSAARTLAVVLAVGVPLAVLDRGARPFVERPTALYVPDPELGWTHRPETTDTYWGMRFRINAQGLRGPERTRPKPEGTRRVLVLGDSVVFGLGLEDDADTLPARLERELAGAPGTIECVNAGVCGWSPWQALRWLERGGAAFEPDLVVLGFVLNDLTERFRLARFGGDGPGAQLEYARPEAWNTRGWRGWLGESGIVLALRELRLRRSLRTEGERLTAYHAILAPQSAAIETAWQHVGAELAALREWCAAHDLPFLVVALPYAIQLVHPEQDAPQRRLAEELRRLSVPHIDLLPPFASRASAGMPVEELFLDGVHLTVAGNALAAREIARGIASSSLLP
jgi:lysophospholipase L1-like esterase